MRDICTLTGLDKITSLTKEQLNEISSNTAGNTLTALFASDDKSVLFYDVKNPVLGETTPIYSIELPELPKSTEATRDDVYFAWTGNLPYPEGTSPIETVDGSILTTSDGEILLVEV